MGDLIHLNPSKLNLIKLIIKLKVKMNAVSADITYCFAAFITDFACL